MVYDINLKGNNFSSFPKNLIEYNSKLYFSATSEDNTKLWEYDPAKDTVVYYDFSANKDSKPRDFVKARGLLYFIALNENGVRNIWSFNGTDISICNTKKPVYEIISYKDNVYCYIDDSTSRKGFGMLGEHNEIISILTGCDFRTYKDSPSFIVFNEKLYFYALACDGNYYQFWEYNGIDAPKAIYEFRQAISNCYVFKDKLYFQTYDTEHGYELWTYNGTDEPYMVADLFPGKHSSYPQKFTAFNDKLYFYGDNEVSALWEYDGTNDPVMIQDAIGNGDITVFKNSLYFKGQPESSYGSSLYKYNGVAFTEVFTSQNNSFNEFYTMQDKLFFTSTAENKGTELWVYDGTNNPQLVCDINTGTGSSAPKNLYAGTDKLYFSADDGIHGRELWEYNGTDIPELHNLNEKINIQYEPLRIEVGSDPANFLEFNGKLYFSAEDSIYGNELWQYDSENFHVFDLWESRSSFPVDLIEYNNKMYFCSKTQNNGNRLWVSDGTGTPSEIVGDYSISTRNGIPTLVTFNNKIYFYSVKDDVFNIWEFNGTDAPKRILEIAQTAQDEFSKHSYILDIFEFNNKLYSIISEYGIGTSMWEYNGVETPIKLITFTEYFATNTTIQKAVFQDNLYFTINNGKNSNSLWMFNGNTPPTKQFGDISLRIGTIYNVLYFKNKLYFTSINEEGAGFWVYNGSGDPVPLNEVVEQSNSFKNTRYVKNTLVYNETMYFSTILLSGPNHEEIWSFDGVSAPQKLFYIDIQENDDDKDLSINNFTVFKDNVYFTADDGKHGNELWKICPSTYSEFEIQTCDSYTSPSGKTFSESGIYNDTIPNTNGCDSIITINLTVNESIETVDLVSTCDSFSWIDGNEYSESSSGISDTLMRSNGCDSIVMLNLTINESSFTSIDVESDDVYILPNGMAINESGKYIIKEISKNGCDSIIEYNVRIGINEGIDMRNEGLSIYPNPAKDVLTVTFNEQFTGSVEVVNEEGDIVATKSIKSANNIDLNVSKLASGTYILIIGNDNNSIPFVKE